MSKQTSDLRSQLLEILAAPNYQPAKDHELANELGIRSERGPFRALLRELEGEGRIVCVRGNRYRLARQPDGVRGFLRMNLQGHGYFQPEKKGEGSDLFLHKDHLGNALDGDLILVEPLKPTTRSRMFAKPDAAAQNLATDGKIIRVIERKRTQVVGLLQQSQKYWYVIPDSPRVTQNVRVSKFDPAIKVPRSGRKVVVTLDPNGHLFEMLSGVVTEDLGEPNAPGVDVVSILRDREISEKFPEHVQQAADSRSVALDSGDLQGRLDLREIPTVTIDPIDAKDFDDAVSLLRNSDGTFKLYVHIADVAHFVPMHSTVDKEALHRGNSIYMVDRHVPMLPKHLTADVCSLRPHSDRLAHTVIADLDRDGNVIHVETARAVIHSKLRLNYEQVQDFIDHKSEEPVPPPLRPMLRDMIAMSQTLRDKRMRNGSLDLAMPEVKIELDKLGRPTGIHRRGSSEAYHVVEEFMLVANVCVAQILARHAIPTLYRIHELPSDEQWEKMAIDLNSLGVRAHPKNHRDLNEVVHQVAGTALEYPVNLAILKNLKRAMYSNERDIHFGLAFESYVHFTSPIRRYADLVVHRGLVALETKQRPPYSPDDCAAIAQQVSTTERTAAEAETESRDVKRIEYYANELANGNTGPHRALVAGFVSRGLICETVETLQRGLLSFASLPGDYYEFDASKGCAIGKRTGHRIKLGDEISITIARVDTVKRLVDFAPAEGAGDGVPSRRPFTNGKNNRPDARERNEHRRGGKRHDERRGKEGGTHQQAEPSRGQHPQRGQQQKRKHPVQNNKANANNPNRIGKQGPQPIQRSGENTRPSAPASSNTRSYIKVQHRSLGKKTGGQRGRH